MGKVQGLKVGTVHNVTGDKSHPRLPRQERRAKGLADVGEPPRALASPRWLRKISPCVHMPMSIAVPWKTNHKRDFFEGGFLGRIGCSSKPRQQQKAGSSKGTSLKSSH